MGILELFEKLDIEASNWTDELGIDLPERVESFYKAFNKYAFLHDLKLDIFAIAKQRFLFFNFLLNGKSLDFTDELARHVKPYISTFGRLGLV